MRAPLGALAAAALLSAGCGKTAPSSYSEPAKLARSVEARWNATMNPRRTSGAVPVRERVSQVLCVSAGPPREYICTGALYAGPGAAGSVVRASRRVLVSPDGSSWAVRE